MQDLDNMSYSEIHAHAQQLRAEALRDMVVAARKAIGALFARSKPEIAAQQA